jgi:hypothetical protein
LARDSVFLTHLAGRGIAVAAFAALGACAYPVVPTVVSARIAPTDSVAGAVAPVAVVEVRTHNISPVLTVVAWDADETGYGLQAVLPRNGEPLPAGSRLTDHRLYLAADLFVEAAGPRRAEQRTRELLVGGLRGEQKPCDGGNCLPARTYGVLIPDAVLREQRDSVVVRLYTRTDREFEVVLRGQLVQGYLRTIDSVATSLQSKATRTK